MSKASDTKEKAAPPPLEQVAEPAEPGTATAPPPDQHADTLAPDAGTETSPTAEPVRCYVLRQFAHEDRTYWPGDWLELPPDWVAEHQRAGNVTDYAGYLARATTPGGNHHQ